MRGDGSMRVQPKARSWLVRDIGLVLVLKLALLMLLYYAFFAHPLARLLTPELVARHLATGDGAASASHREVP